MIYTQEIISKWCDETFKNRDIKSRFFSLLEEVAELSTKLNIPSTEVLEQFNKCVHRALKQLDDSEPVSGEVADIFICLADVSSGINVDIMTAVDDKMSIVTQKDAEHFAKKAQQKASEGIR